MTQNTFLDILNSKEHNSRNFEFLSDKLRQDHGLGRGCGHGGGSGHRYDLVFQDSPGQTLDEGHISWKNSRRNRQHPETNIPCVTGILSPVSAFLGIGFTLCSWVSSVSPSKKVTLKFYLLGQIGLGGLCRIRSDWSSLIRVFTISNSMDIIYMLLH